MTTNNKTSAVSLRAVSLWLFCLCLVIIYRHMQWTEWRLVPLCVVSFVIYCLCAKTNGKIF